MTADQVFLDYSAHKLRQFASRIGVCLDKLTYDQIWYRAAENSNAVGNLVLHLCGNMRQWIGTGVGNKPDIRVRDREFAARGEIQAAELKERLDATVEEAITIIASVSSQRLLERIKVQRYDVTVLEGIYHVVEHFAQHTAQILFATKAFTGEDLGFYKSAGQATAAGAKP